MGLETKDVHVKVGACASHCSVNAGSMGRKMGWGWEVLRRKRQILKAPSLREVLVERWAGEALGRKLDWAITTLVA